MISVVFLVFEVRRAFWFLILGTIWSCPDIPATGIPGLISAGAESVVQSAEEFLDDLSDKSSECNGTIWSCPDLPATVIPGLISANAESAEDFTVDLSDNSSECIGTSRVSLLLPDMVLMASDSRISAIGISKHKKKKSVKGTPTQLKIEKAVEGNLAKLRLEENTTTSTPKPEDEKTSWAVIAEKPFQFPFRHPCELCNVFGHWHHSCPYLECMPDNVTQVPKGYEICYKHGVRYAEMIDCVLCSKFCDHVSENCPERSKFTALIDSVIGISRPKPSSC